MFLLFSNQLFPVENLSGQKSKKILMIEDFQEFSKFRFHKQKLIFEISAMRSYAESLKNSGFDVHYQKLSGGKSVASLESRLKELVQAHSIKKISTFEIEDLALEERLKEFCKKEKVKIEFEKSPMFLTSRKEFSDYLKSLETSKGRPFMRNFYQLKRKKSKILVDKDGDPIGGQFSFENMNSLRMARELRPAAPPEAKPNLIVKEVAILVGDLFPKNPGNTKDFWWPTTREQALSWLENFVSERLTRFADYEDALPSHTDIAYHSALSPLLNLGLITPTEVLQSVLESGKKNEISLQSLEGFIRQILGWREYARGIYQNFGDELPDANFWNHNRKLNNAWFDGTTGLGFLDETIKKAIRLGYNHPIERLMVVSNIMLLCEVDPREAYQWFMEFYVDSADWVTSPNVFGLGQFADGGLMATRPYICGSSYIRKMSHHAEGPWCDILDGLYWSFIEKNSKVFAANPRISMALPALRRLDPSHKQKIFSDAEKFKAKVTSA